MGSRQRKSVDPGRVLAETETTEIAAVIEENLGQDLTIGGRRRGGVDPENIVAETPAKDVETQGIEGTATAIEEIVGLVVVLTTEAASGRRLKRRSPLAE